MIYHAFNLAPTGKPQLEWWAVHAETLTPVMVRASRMPGVTLEIVAPPPDEVPVFSSHPYLPFDSKAIAREVFQSIKHHIHPLAVLQTSRTIPRAQAKVPEYLMLFDGSGAQPAIFRSTDPHLIIPANQPDESTLAAPIYWRTSTDLPVTGWEYWWTDCQLAWDEMAPAFIAATDRS